MGEAQGCMHSKRCTHRFVSIGPQGRVYPCGRFNGMERFELGEVQEDTLETMFARPLYQDLDRRFASIAELCGTCPFYKVCHGGCMYDAYEHHQTVHQPDAFCQGWKRIFAHASRAIREEMERAGLSPVKDAVFASAGLPPCRSSEGANPPIGE